MSNKECENCGYFCKADSMCHRLDYPINDISKIRDDCPRKEEIIMESMRRFQEEHCVEQKPRTGEVTPKADLDKTEDGERVSEGFGNYLLRTWKRRLGLLDWVIKLKVDQLPEDMPPDAMGHVEYVTASRTACIRILDPNCYSKDRVLPFNFEHVLLHELLHLKFAVLDGIGGEVGETVIHQMIDEFAWILTGENIYGRGDIDEW